MEECNGRVSLGQKCARLRKVLDGASRSGTKTSTFESARAFSEDGRRGRQGQIETSI